MKRAGARQIGPKASRIEQEAARRAGGFMVKEAAAQAVHDHP